MQAVCDHRCYFLDYELGWPGSVNDSTVWNESRIAQNPAAFFEPDEYILVDKGMLTPCLSSGKC